MISKADQLIELAEMAGFKLTDPELKLLRCVAAGELADYSDENKEQNDLEQAGEWEKKRKLSAKLITWLCTDRKAREFIINQGLQVVGVRIQGPLDLSFAHMEFPLALRHCTLPKGLSIKQATVKLLDLSGSRLGSNIIRAASGGHVKVALQASGIQVKGDLVLGYSFQAFADVLVSGASIGGNLDCSGGKFTSSLGDALTAQNAVIGGSVYLRDGFSAAGLVWISGISIGGNLDCAQAKFINNTKRPNNLAKYALVVQNAEIKGNVVLNNRFEATGTVSFFGSKVGGDFICEESSFNHIGYISLILNNSEVKGNLSLSSGFTSTGEVKLSNAYIGGNLNCCGGKFNNSKYGHVDPLALDASYTQIKGSVFLNYHFHSVGKVGIDNILIKGDLNCRGAKFESNKNIYSSGTDALLNMPNELKKFYDPISLNACSAEIGGSVFLSDQVFIDGRVSFLNAKIGKFFHLDLRGYKKIYIDLRSAKIFGFTDSKEGWPEPGFLDLDGCVYEQYSQNSPVRGDERLEWIRLCTKKSYTPQPYEQSALVLKSNGHQDAAVKVLIGKQNDLREFGGLTGIKWLWNWFLGKTIAHGYKSHRALWISLSIITFGAILFHIGYSQGLIEPSELEAYSFTISENPDSTPIKPDPNARPQIIKTSPSYPEFASLMYSVDVFIPIIDFHQERFWLPRASRGREIPVLKVRRGGLLLAYFWLHILLGWVFTSLWVASFTGLVRQLE